MTEQIVPNTDQPRVAMLAVAWEIVNKTYDIPHLEGSREEKLEKLTNAVIKIYNAIFNGTPIPSK
jgi:hypothetical protein